MKIVQAGHKKVLFDLFFELAGRTAQGAPAYEGRKFPIDKLADAASAAKKLTKGSTPILDDKGNPTGSLMLSGTAVEFSPNEVSLLKELFDGRTEWPFGEADTVLALKNIFAGKNGKEEA